MTLDRAAIATEMRTLIADLRTHLDAARSVGVLAERKDAPRPEAIAPSPTLPDMAAALPAASGAPEDALPPPARVPTPIASAWTSVAEAARTGAVPGHVTGGSADALGAAGLAAIAAELDGCTRCTLCAQRHSVVVGSGDPDADLMVIGEPPDEHEDLHGAPFAGPSGEMLDRMLANVLGLSRPKVYVTTVVKCRPPGSRDPLPANFAACLPFLHRQIRAVQPKLLLVMGRAASHHLLGLRSLAREHGQERSWEGIPAIATFHPAHLIKMPDDKRVAFEDLRKARQHYDALGGRR